MYDKNEYQSLILDKSLVNKNYIPKLNIYSDDFRESFLERNQNYTITYYLNYPSNFDGDKFLEEFLNFSKLKALEDTKNKITYKLTQKIDGLELEFKILSLSLKNLNQNILNNQKENNDINTELFKLSYNYYALASNIERLKRFKQDLINQNFNFNIIESNFENNFTNEKKNFKENQFKKIIKKKSIGNIVKGFLLGLILSIFYIFVAYVVSNQNEKSRIFK